MSMQKPEGETVTVDILLRVQGSSVENLVGSVVVPNNSDEEVPEGAPSNAGFRLHMDIARALRGMADTIDAARKGMNE